jgi:hypothetical protein
MKTSTPEQILPGALVLSIHICGFLVWTLLSTVTGLSTPLGTDNLRAGSKVPEIWEHGFEYRSLDNRLYD